MLSSSSWAQLPHECSRVLLLEDHSLKLRVLSSSMQAPLGCSWMHYPPSGSRLRLGCLLRLLGVLVVRSPSGWGQGLPLPRPLSEL